MPRFKQFYLRQNHASTMPTRMIFYDCETKKVDVGKEQHHRMKLGWTCYCRRKANEGYSREIWKAHTTSKSVCEYIQSLATDKAALFIFGHNIYFDMQASDIFHYFTRWGWILDFSHDKGITYLLIIHKCSARIKFISTTNYFSYKLARVGELIGYPKLKVDFETSTEEELSEYCKRDVEITKVAMGQYFDFLESNDLGKFGFTKASQALNTFRHRFMNQQIAVHKDQDAYELERDSYTGGRVECFRIGEIKGGPFVSLDINSMYPFIMSTKELPTRLIDYMDDVPMKRLDWLLDKGCVIANVDLNTDRPAYPYRMNGKLVFPVGRFNTTLCSPALRYAKDHNHLLKLNVVALYEKALIFKEYVDFFYKIRKEYEKAGNEVYATLSKYLLNTLYGKFGQKKNLITETTDITYDGYYRMPIMNFVTGELETETKMFNKRVIQHGETNGPRSFVAIPSHITEYGRMILWKIIEDLGLKRVLYCDTDSVKIRRVYLPQLTYPIEKHKLGCLDIESTFSRLTLHGPKDYETEDEVKLKGVPRSADMIEPGCYQYLNFMGQATHLRRKITRFFIVKQVTKVNKRTYDKGVVLPNGRVIPFALVHI